MKESISKRGPFIIQEVPALGLGLLVVVTLLILWEKKQNLIWFYSHFFPLQNYRQSFCSSTIKMGTIKK